MKKLLKKNTNGQRIVTLLVVIVIASLGYRLLSASHAEGPYTSADASSGVLSVSGAALNNDNTADGDESVVFGSGTTTGGGTGSNCTSPVASGSAASYTYNTDPSDGYQYYWVDNDAWNGSHGPQTIYVCSASSWYADSDQPNNGGAVETYPNTEYDVGGRDSPSTKTITQWNSITSTFSEAYPSAGSWDAAYDMWTDDWSHETMVWNQWAGTEDYWGDCAEPGTDQNTCGLAPSVAATIDGVAYHFLGLGSSSKCTADQSGCELIFFRDDQVSSGSVDILAIYQWEVANGYAKATDVPTQLEYGVEVCSTSGTETFPMTGLTFSLN